MNTEDGSADASTYPLWHDFQPGAYGCGYRSLWQFDYGRTYDILFEDGTHYAEGKSPRPILTQLWYPSERTASSSPMAYGDYLNIQVEEGPLARFSAELARYARRVLLSEVFYKEEAEFTPAEQEAFRALLQTRTGACRDAEAAEGRFPILIYHGGYGSSFEDSSVLCEYLASQGYVVVGSAFQRVDGTSLNIEGKVRTAGDIRFLLSYAQNLPFTDWNHVGMIGHSGGAHAAIIYQTEPGCVVDATVSLDTTEDYYSLAIPGWKPMRDPVQEALSTLTRPILFAAKPWAGFEMAGTMTSTPRYLYTSDALLHDDFITHGSLARWVKLRLASEAEREAAETEAHQIWNRYEALCRTTLRFLDAMLKGQSDGLDAQIARDREQPFRWDRPRLEYLPVGSDSLEPYPDSDSSPSSPPSPRQVRHLLQTKGADAAVAALRAFWRPETDAPAYHPQFTVGLVYQLVAEGKIEEATALFGFLSEINRSPAQGFLDWSPSGSNRRTFLEFLTAVDPENQEAIQALKLLDESA